MEKEQKAMRALDAPPPGGLERFLTQRTLDEIGASIDAHVRSGCMEFILAGGDLIDAKEKAGRGEWLPFLEAHGIGHSTAANWMRVAREISPESPLAQLAYGKTLALLSLPKEEREDFARDNAAEEKSAAEIRRLIEERNKAMEAANAESTRVSQIERDRNYWKAQAGCIEQERKQAQKKLDQERQGKEEALETVETLRQQIDELSVRPAVEQKIVEVPVTQVPRDYAELKRKAAMADQLVDEATRAAIASEEKARKAEEQLAQIQLAGTGKPAPEGIEAFAAAVNDFIGATQLFQVNPGPLAARMKEYEQIMKRLRMFAIDLGAAVSNADFEAVGSVV